VILLQIKKGKVVDKWKLKKWYTVVAPQMFDSKEIFETVANDDSLVVNRIVKASLFDLISANSQSAMFTTLNLRITSVNGNKAATKLIGHEVAPTYLKTFARRGKTLIHQICDVKTKDGEEVRVKAIAVTAGKISETTATNLRKAINEEIMKNCTPLNYDELMQEILYGRLVAKIFNRVKQIATMKRVEISKTEKKEIFG
jgi:small subunit ribosomal protein S3Ae